MSDGGTVAKTKLPGWRIGSIDARRSLSEVPPGAAMLVVVRRVRLDAEERRAGAELGAV